MPSHTSHTSRRLLSSWIRPVETLAVQELYPYHTRTIWFEQHASGQTLCANVNAPAARDLSAEVLCCVHEEITWGAPLVLVHVDGRVEQPLVSFVVCDCIQVTLERVGQVGFRSYCLCGERGCCLELISIAATPRRLSRTTCSISKT